MKKRALFAIAIILAAVSLLTDAILGAVGVSFFEGFSIGKCFLGVILASVLLNGLFRLGAGRFFMSAAFLFMLFEKEIAHYAGMKSENILSNRLVFFCAILLSVGFGILLSRFRRKREYRKVFKNGAKVVNNHQFSNTVRYADSTCPEHFYENKMGNLEVYFDNVDQYKGNAKVHVVNRMGRIALHVPSNWHIDCNITNHMGHVYTQKGDPDGKSIYITGSNHMGQIEIIEV